MTLRLRLVLLVLALTTTLLGGLGVYVGASLRQWTVEVVDGELTRRAELLRHKLRFEASGRLEVDDDDDDDLRSRGLPFRVEAANGEVLGGSANWVATELPTDGFSTVEASTGKPLRVLSMPLRPKHGHGQYVLRVAAPLTAYSGLADRFRNGLLIALVLEVVLGAAGAMVVARVLLKPLRRLSRDVDDIGAASLETRLDARGLGPELSRMAEAFNGVMGRLSEAFATQRAFVQRASHALRTPLASILSQAEVSLLRERSPEAYRDTLSTIAESARESSRLADGLLALTRADAGTGEGKSRVALDALSAELGRLFGPRAEVLGLGFTALAPAGLAIEATRGRLRELLDALLDNAFRYTPTGGAVRFEARREGEFVVLEVVDSGPGIRANEREKVFERFYRGSAATETGQAGSGLGLPVVKALAEAEGATVELEDAPGGGTRVRVCFKDATPQGSGSEDV